MLKAFLFSSCAYLKRRIAKANMKMECQQDRIGEVCLCQHLLPTWLQTQFPYTIVIILIYHSSHVSSVAVLELAGQN